MLRFAGNLLRQGFGQGARRGASRVTGDVVEESINNAARQGVNVTGDVGTVYTRGTTSGTTGNSLANRISSGVGWALNNPLKTGLLAAPIVGGRVLGDMYNAVDTALDGKLLGGVSEAEAAQRKAANTSDNGGSEAPSQPPVQPPSSSSPSGPSPSPYGNPNETNNQILTELLRGLRADSERTGDLTAQLLDPAYIAQVTGVQRDAQIAVDAAAGNLALEKMREKSARDQSIARINAWKEVERASIQSNAIIASSLASTAYAAATPNASVLSALSGPTQAAMKAFSGGQNVIK